MDTSDELDQLPIEQIAIETQVDQFIAGAMANQDKSFGRKYINDGERPHCSQDKNYDQTNQQLKAVQPVQPPLQLTRAEQLIRDVEVSKARILEVPFNEKILNKAYLHPLLLDEDYLVIGGFVDQSTREKIGNGEYIDFSKLIPKDHVTSEEDNRMEMINKGGMSYWVPVSDREVSSINGFNKWEQAFRVFSNIYTSYHPDRAGELIQYNHVIHTAAQNFGTTFTIMIKNSGFICHDTT